MIVIGDNRLPGEVKENLKRFADFVPFTTKNITYNAVSGHPDVFLCQAGNDVVAAPNIPFDYKQILKNSGVNVIEGENNAGEKYPFSAQYNAVVTGKHLIHNLKITDKVILETCRDKKQINVNQGYTRCSLFAVDDFSFITSDKGIYKTLADFDVETLYVDSSEVILPDFSNGFIGGCFGKKDNRIFITGSLSSIKDGKSIHNFITERGYEIVELYKGPLFDGGGLFFF